jgi:hypothetical protein
MHPTPQGVTLDFEQYDQLKVVDKVLPTLLPELKNMLPCQFIHQNVAIYCSVTLSQLVNKTSRWFWMTLID